MTAHQLSDQHWKRDSQDLRVLAATATMTDGVRSSPQLSARATVVCLFGVIHMVSTMFGVDAMQRACADLVRCPVAWSSMLARLPHGAGSAATVIAHMARGVVTLSGTANMRAALSFWATEDDPAVWQRIAGI